MIALLGEYRKNLVGYVYSMDFNEALVLTNDAWKSSVSKSPNFGDETYYGQNFFLKTEKGQMFVVAVPYPFATKQDKVRFAQEKVDVSRYQDLGRAFDLYHSAVVPIALAHRHASISPVPGGKVLDLVSRHGLNRN